MKKIKIHIDTINYLQKPVNIGNMKPRLQNNNTIIEKSILDIVVKIEQGYSISPAVLIDGCKSINWKEQSLFMVDIDNDSTDYPILNVTDALKICEDNNLIPAFYYFSFSHSEEKPKYRLAFLMNEVVNDSKIRERIIRTLISLFNQSDSQCYNADRIFFGTNKKVVIHNIDATITLDAINSIKIKTHQIQATTNNINKGNRNNTLFKSACKLKKQGIPDDEIFALIKKENIEKCNPILQDNELKTLVNSAITRVDSLPCYIVATTDKNNNTKYSVSTQILAEHIRETEHYFLVRDNVDSCTLIFWYINGFYRKINDDLFKGIIKKFISDYDINLYKSSIVNEVFKDLTTDLKYISQDKLNIHENIINFENGNYDLFTKKLSVHTPNIPTTIQMPTIWNESDCISAPHFEKFINTLTGGREDKKSLLLQFIGACISNIKGYRFKKALFMVGAGDTGKSQLKSLVEKLLGNDNYTGIDLPEIEERFGTSMLYNKRLAGSSDMSFVSIKELKQFKRLTGGDSVFTEFKGYQGFDQIYNGLLWFCCNKLPKFSGDNGAWVYDRILVIKCENVIPKEKQDKYLLDKMYEEREAIVKMAVAELQKALKDGNVEFIVSDDILNESKIYRKDNNTVEKFIEDCCTDRSHYNDGCTTKKLYDVYNAWCKDNNHGYAKTQKEFREELSELSGLPEDKLIKRTKTNNFYAPYTITPATYHAYYDVYEFNQYFHSLKD